MAVPQYDKRDADSIPPYIWRDKSDDKTYLDDNLEVRGSVVAAGVTLGAALGPAYGVFLPESYGTTGTADDTVPVTAAIVAASAAKGTVLLSKVYTVQPLTGLSDTLIWALSPSFGFKLKDSQPSFSRILTYASKSNIAVIRISLDGNKANQSADSTDQDAGILFDTCTNYRAEGLNITNTHGDGAMIYGVTNPCVDGFLIGLRITLHRRQALAIISARNLTIEGIIIEDGENYSLGGGGVHLEADSGGQFLQNISISGVDARNVNGGITCAGSPTGESANFKGLSITTFTIDTTLQGSSGVEINGFIGVALGPGVIRNTAGIGVFFRSAKSTITGLLIEDSGSIGLAIQGVSSLLPNQITLTGIDIVRYDVNNAGIAGLQIADATVVSLSGFTIFDGQANGSQGLVVINSCVRVNCRNGVVGATTNRSSGVGIWVRNAGTAPDRTSIEGVDVYNFNTLYADSGTLTAFRPARAAALQAIASAASVTPDALEGDAVDISALAVNITINAPLNPFKGAILEFMLLQDGTGGRTVTWNAAFIKTWSDTGNTLNTRASTRYRYNGANWVQVGAQRTWA